MSTKWTPIGSMRHKITIQSIATTPTTGGETTDTASTHKTAMARIEPLGGKEIYLARAAQDTSTHRINMLYQSGITPLMQAVYNGRTFNFVSVIDKDEIHKELEITAVEVLS